MSGVVPEGDLVEVELDDGAPGRQRSRARGPRRRRRLPARAWSRLALPIALVLGAGAALDGAAAAHLAAPGAGLAPDLRVPRRVEWRAPISNVLALVGDTVLVQSRDRANVVALDLRDGAVRWTFPMSDCRPLEAVPDPVGTDGSVLWRIAPADARLLCVDNTTPLTPPTLLVDAATGTVLARVPGLQDLPTGVMDDGVLVLPSASWADEQGFTALDLRSGATLWTRPIPRGWRGGIGALGGAVITDEMPEGSTEASPDGWAGVAYDLRTGDRVELPPPDEETGTATTLADGTVLRTTWTGNGPTLTVRAPDGAELWRADAYPGPAVLSGDLRAVVTSAVDGGIAARDVATGDVLWTDDRWWIPQDVVGDTIVALDALPVTDPGDEEGFLAVSGLDARSGDVLWAIRVEPGALAQRLVTDGARFAVLASSGVEVRDGRTGDVVARWAVPTTADWESTSPSSTYVFDGMTVVGDSSIGSQLVPLPGGRVLVVRGREVVVLGW